MPVQAVHGRGSHPENGREHICLIGRCGTEGKGGLATYMQELGSGLRDRRGWKVSTAVRFLGNGPRGCEYALADITLPEAAALPFPTALVRPKAMYRPLLNRLLTLLARPATRPLALLLFRAAYREAVRAAIPQDATCVHYIGTGWELLGFVAQEEAKRRNISFSCLPAVHPGEWGDSEVDISFYGRCDVVLTLSNSEKEYLASRGVPPERMQVVPLGAASAPPPGDGLAFRARHGIGNRPMILYVGRRQRYKGYHSLAEAMPRILEAVPDAVLTCIGPWGEPPYPEVPEGALLDLGQATDEEKEDALAACDVFCLPSVGESFGIVYVEAWRYGKPVIAGSAPALSELIQDDVNGYCVPQDPGRIAQVASHLLLNASLRERLGQAGRRLQQERYTWEKVIDAFVDVIHSVRSGQDVPAATGSNERRQAVSNNS